ncbi:MAG TPA: hypothetical protein P5060_03690 [Candidatus Absconditabacterales bacterium]|nr:hypothetical protein [Candidatus Absconditabacterales bacterium]
MTEIFLIANTFIIIGTILYILNIHKKSISLNLSSRTIRIFLELIDAVSYIKIVTENIKGLMAVISMVGMSIIALLAIKKGRFKKLSKFDILLLMIGILTIIAGIISKSYIVTNVSLQIAFLMAYIPTIKGIYKKEIQEKTFPWIITSIGIITSIIGLILYYEGRFTLIYPSARLFGNAALILSTIIVKNKGKKIGQQ